MALSFVRDRKSDSTVISKVKNAKQRTAMKGGTNISALIQQMISLANTKLAHHKDDYIIIRDKMELENYIQIASKNEECAIDTETTGLNPLLIDIVGVCLYTPTQKACYIPINHKSYVTGARTDNQLTENEVADVLLKFKGKWIMHNAKYDIRVMRHTLGIDLDCFWDTMLAGCCIDEEESHRLKDMHLKYCDSSDTESLTFDKLFNGVTFDNVPISTAYLYAAGDALKTYELYKYQQTILNRRTLSGPYRVFTEIEMPVLKVVCDMEDRGVMLDMEVCEKLHEKYHKMREDAQKRADKAISMYADEIETYKMKNINHKLSDPISLSSPTQLAILFYDILKMESPDKKSPRGTGEDIMKEFAKGKHKDICESILEIRRLDKLIGTYIDKMPDVAHKDGRIHASYNQYGAKTGRFSSSDPNLQNIPSHNKEIRQMFRAMDGGVLIGADFSQQEPMVTAHLSDDETMKNAFKNGKDIYATIAGIAFDKPYEECLEFRKDGTTNPEGKERRSHAKAIVLGILYGKQVPSIGTDLGISTKKAQEIYDKVLMSFPKLKKFMDDSQNDARKYGYVETAWGRRRHLKDMQLEPYEYSYDEKQINFDPLAFNENISIEDVPEKTKKYFSDKFKKCKTWKDKEKVKQECAYKGIKLKDNGAFIAQAERQCVNSRVQGSAADITKLAMIAVGNDERLKELDFHLIIQVHDELIGECPKENARECAERLSYLMRTAPTSLIDLPFKCDTETTYNWYGENVKVYK